MGEAADGNPPRRARPKEFFKQPLSTPYGSKTVHCRPQGGSRTAATVLHEPLDGQPDRPPAPYLKFAGPTGQKRANISGKRFRICLARARGAAAPGGPGSRLPELPGAALGAPGAPHERPRRRQVGGRPHGLRPRALQDAQDGLKAAQDAPETPQGASKRPPERAPRGTFIDFPLILKNSDVLAFSTSRRSKTAQGPPRPPQDGPRGLQEGLERQIT